MASKALSFLYQFKLSPNSSLQIIKFNLTTAKSFSIKFRNFAAAAAISRPIGGEEIPPAGGSRGEIAMKCEYEDPWILDVGLNFPLDSHF